MRIFVLKTPERYGTHIVTQQDSMAVTLVQNPNGSEAQKKPRQGRSPAFPFISLQKALERAETFRVAEGGRPKHFAPITAVAKAWGIGPKTGVSIQTVAALGHFGLFEFQGAGDERNARLTETSLNILLDKQPTSPERDALIRQAALKPPIHNELWQKWGDSLPSDATFETFLVRDKGFSEPGARDLIAEYKATIQFAKLSQSGYLPTGETNKKEVKKTPQEPEIGDLVQVEIGGALQFEKPVRVRAIQDHEDRKWVFVEGSESGISMEQVIVEQKGHVGDSKQPIVPPVLKEDPPKPGTRKEVFALDEGDVVLTFPDKLSETSFQDLDAYLKVFIAKMRRRAGAGGNDQ